MDRSCPPVNPRIPRKSGDVDCIRIYPVCGGAISSRAAHLWAYTRRPNHVPKTTGLVQASATVAHGRSARKVETATDIVGHIRPTGGRRDSTRLRDSSRRRDPPTVALSATEARALHRSTGTRCATWRGASRPCSAAKRRPSRPSAGPRGNTPATQRHRPNSGTSPPPASREGSPSRGYAPTKDPSSARSSAPKMEDLRRRSVGLNVLSGPRNRTTSFLSTA